MDVYSKGFQDVNAIRLELLRKNEIQLSTMLIRIYCEYNPFVRELTSISHKTIQHCLFFHVILCLIYKKTGLKLQEISRE